MKKILDKRNMSEQDWQEYRQSQKGLGGSEIATILNVGYGSKFTLWLEKTGQKTKEPVDNEYVLWGNLLEPVIRQQFSKETGFKVYKNNFVLQHDTHDFMTANIDGEVIDPNQDGRGILEIKTTSEWNKKEWQGENVPLAYMAQVQHYLAVTGYNYAYIVVLIGGNKLRYWFIERNEQLIDKIIEEEKAFMQAVENKEYPWEIGGSQDESNWLANQFPNAIDEEMSIPPSIEEMALEYEDLAKEKKEIEKRMNEIKNQIKLEGKEFGKLKGSKVIINMPTIKKILFDSKKFKEDHNKLYEEYRTKESSYRDFKVKVMEG